MNVFPGQGTNCLTNHACSIVEIQGWRGVRNGVLLERAEAEFDLFITSDQNIRYQQNLAGRSIAILELSTNDLRRIQAAKVIIQDAVPEIQQTEFRRLTIP
jgi:hypothetical protein